MKKKSEIVEKRPYICKNWYCNTADRRTKELVSNFLWGNLLSLHQRNGWGLRIRISVHIVTSL